LWSFGVARTIELKLCRNVETLNRCRAVTDKSQSAWQKGAIRCNGCVLKSVYREVHGVALAA
jgi:hypothetical protein